MVQLAGGVTAVQLKPIALEEDAVAVSPVGAEGTVVHTGVTGVVARGLRRGRRCTVCVNRFNHVVVGRRTCEAGVGVAGSGNAARN